MSERAFSHSSLEVAFLPGVGFVVDPTPWQYREAIRWLRERPAWSMERNGLADRLEATLKRIEWSRK